MPLGRDGPASRHEDASLLLQVRTGLGLSQTSPAKLGVAVSGGSDSMAMLHLMARAAPHEGWTLHAVTVDHRLRAEAAEEAAFVGRACEALGVPHDMLVWDHGAITGNLMQAASAARYALMAEWARRNGLDLVTLAHTADDQAENFLIGLSRAAGLDGLTGMRPAFMVEGIAFRRPFLRLTRATLRDYLARHALPWIEDPSNDDIRFARVKARRALKVLKPLGITVDRLASVMHNLVMARGVVHRAVAQAGHEIIIETAGSLAFQRRAFRAADPEVQRLLLIAMVRWIAGARHPPRESKVFALAVALDRQKDATLGGVRFRWHGETCWVSREARACGGPVPVGVPWDGRWQVAGAEGEVRALGTAGLLGCADWRATGLPRQVLEVTPAVWRGETLIAAPLAGFGAGWTAKTDPSFATFLLSH